jgi:hypothetical protein
MRKSLLPVVGLAAIAAAGLGSSSAFGSAAEVLHRPPRASGYRQGRRFRGDGTRIDGKGAENPAGTKLLRLAAKGALTICRIR